ncbi:MAG: alpha/beta hydrolase [Cucumibacter sp.]
MIASALHSAARLAGILLLGFAAGGFSVFDLLDNALPKDSGGERLASDVPYGAGPRHMLDVYAPKGLENAAPVILFVYGGSWNRGERRDYEFVGHALAARGFVTVIADYRLVPEVAYPGFVEDCAAAVGWIERNIGDYGGDPRRLFLAGHSAGAYNVAMLALEPAFLRDQGVTVKVRGVAGLSGPYSFYPFRVDEAIAAFGDAPNPEGTQPVNLVTADSPPMFLATGTGDLIVRPSNTTLLAAKLRANNVPVTERYYDGLGHMDPVMALSMIWRGRAPVLDDMVAFFNEQGAFNPASVEPPLLSP